jgi:hypothetical protein
MPHLVVTLLAHEVRCSIASSLYCIFPYHFFTVLVVPQFLEFQLEEFKTSRIHFAVLIKMQMKGGILKEMHLKLRQFRVDKNGSTWPINMTFGLILTLEKCNHEMASKTQHGKFGTRLFSC